MRHSRAIVFPSKTVLFLAGIQVGDEDNFRVIDKRGHSSHNSPKYKILMHFAPELFLFRSGLSVTQREISQTDLVLRELFATSVF